MAFLKDNSRLILVTLLVLAASSVILLNEQNSVIVVVNYCLLGAILLPLFLKQVDTAIWLIIGLAPISLGATLPFLSLRMSIPTELLTGCLLFIFGIKMLAGLRFDKRLLRHPVSIILILDICWSAISAFQSELSEVALKRLLMKTLFIAVYFFIFANQLDSTKKQKRLFLLYAIGAIYPIYHAISVHAHRGFGHNTAFDISAPFYSDHTVYGACLAFVFPFLIIYSIELSKNKSAYQLGGWLLTVLFGAGIVFSYSRASWISLIIAGGFVLLTRLRVRMLHILLGLVITVTLVVVNFEMIYASMRDNETKYGDDIATHLSSVSNLQSDQSNLERVNRWVCAYRMFEDEPITGFGPGTYQFIYDRYQTPEFMTRISTHRGDRGNAHSEYLSALSETGIVGFLLFLLLLFYVLHVGLKLLYAPLVRAERLIVLSALLGLITFYTHGLFNTFSDIEKMGVLLYGSIAILVVHDLKLVKK